MTHEGCAPGFLHTSVIAPLSRTQHQSNPSCSVSNSTRRCVRCETAICWLYANFLHPFCPFSSIMDASSPCVIGVSLSESTTISSSRVDSQRSLRKCRTIPTICRNLSFFLCLRAIKALAVSSGSCAKEKMLLTLSSAFMSPVFWKSLMRASWFTVSKMFAAARLRCAVSNLLPRSEGQTRRDSVYMSVDILRLSLGFVALELPTREAEPLWWQ